MSSSLPRLVFVINSLVGGGAERVFTTIVRELEPYINEYDVHVVLLDKLDETYPLPSYINKHVLDARGSFFRSGFALYSLLKRIRPDLVLSFLNRSNFANILSAPFFDHKTIISERVHTTSHFASGLRSSINKLIVRLSYPHANHVIAVSEGIKKDLCDNYGVSSECVSVIYNPFDRKAITELGAEEPSVDLPSRFIASVGRLVPNKNFSMLISAYAKSGIDCDLVILGDGEERDDLQALAKSLGVTDRVHMPGFAKNPYAVVARSLFFVSASNAEGFPNALTEALVLGRAVLATDCDSGPAEILAGVVRANREEMWKADYGVLVPMNNEKQMILGLRAMMGDETRSHYEANAPVRASDFGLGEVAAQYMSAIQGQLDAR